jgi:hypothetical protein
MLLNKSKARMITSPKVSLFALILLLAFVKVPAQITLWGVDISRIDTSSKSSKFVTLKTNPYFSHVSIQYSLTTTATFIFGSNRMKEASPQILEPVSHTKSLSDIISEKLGESIPVNRELYGSCSGRIENFFLWKKEDKGGNWITAYMTPVSGGFSLHTFLHPTERKANEYIFNELLQKAGRLSDCVDADTKKKFHLE